METLELDIIGNLPEGLETAPVERVFAALIAEVEELPGGIINVAFTDDAGIRDVNRDYSGNDYATDVLSFSYIEDGGQPIENVIGEVVVSLETAQRQADEAGTSLSDEVALLVLHGTLHVLGHDHQDEVQQEWMQSLQRRLMATAGNKYRELVWEQ